MKEEIPDDIPQISWQMVDGELQECLNEAAVLAVCAKVDSPKAREFAERIRRARLHIAESSGEVVV